MTGDPIISGENAGWLIALVTTTWGIVLRYVIGHYIGVAKAQKQIADKIQLQLTSIENRLTVIESRSFYRRKADPK